MAKSPFISDAGAINTAFKKTVKPIFSRDTVDFTATTAKIYPKNFVNLQYLRYAHVDLGLTSDHAGICIGHVSRFDQIEDEGITYQMPHIHIDGLLSVAPPTNGEINFAKIRKTLTTLYDLGLPIKWISFDSYQSVDSMQILRSMGFTTGKVSLDDKNLNLYHWAKQAILHERVDCAPNDILQRELIQLEKMPDGKVDHPTHGSKDLADAFAGVCYGLTVQRDNWSAHGVSPHQMLLDKLAVVTVYKEGSSD